MQNKCKAISDKMVFSKPKPHQPNKQAILNHLSESFKQQNTNMHLYLDRSYCSNGHNGHVFLFHLLNKISGIFYDSTKYTYSKCTNAITQSEHTHTHSLEPQTVCFFFGCWSVNICADPKSMKCSFDAQTLKSIRFNLQRFIFYSLWLRENLRSKVATVIRWYFISENHVHA